MATKDQVIRLHRRNPEWTARMIADEIGCVPEYVNATAQRQGLALPRARFNTQKCGVQFRVKPSVMAQFEAAAFEYAVPPNELAKHLIETIVNDNLFEAVIDKAPIAPNGFEQVGIPLNRALTKLAKGKPLDGEV